MREREGDRGEERKREREIGREEERKCVYDRKNRNTEREKEQKSPQSPSRQ